MLLHDSDHDNQGPTEIVCTFLRLTIPVIGKTRTRVDGSLVAILFHVTIERYLNSCVGTTEGHPGDSTPKLCVTVR